MKLLTEEIKKKLPPLYANESLPDAGDAIAQVKFFNPTGMGTWYATEFDGEDSFFGLVDLFEKEIGYFSLSELESVKLRFGLSIERDLHFTPQPIKNFM